MASEAISSSSIDLCNLMMIYDTTCLVENNVVNPQNFHVGASAIPTVAACGYVTGEMAGRRRNLGVQGRKKKRRGRRGGKNEEEADTQRMAHIVLERNLRKRMNEHLAVLRSLVPESHAQRDDQASIVDGAIENVKELERLLQSLEVQKMLFVQKGGSQGHNDMASTAATTTSSKPPFSEFFTYHRNTGSQSPIPNRCSSGRRASTAEIKVTLTEKHANVWILSRRIPSLLSKLVAGFQTLHLSIQHLNVNHLDLLVPYSISAKSGCCKPPTECGYTFINPTYWISPIDTAADMDCLGWSNDQNQLCYGCSSCKAGLLANLRKEWRRADVVLLITLIALIWVYLIGCCAFRNAKTEDLFRRYKQGYT